MLTISISSCWFNFNANSWWGETDFGQTAASVITQTSSTVAVYSDQRLSPFLAFALSLRPIDSVMWLDESSSLPAAIFDSTQPVFLFAPSNALLSQIDQVSAIKGFTADSSQSHFLLEGSRSRLFQIQQARTTAGADALGEARTSTRRRATPSKEESKYI